MPTNHTPGPWYFACDADGTMVTDDTGAQIAMWPPQGGTVEQCANARLIAAAPELLAVLKDIGKFTGEGSMYTTPWQDIVRSIGEKARAAIARAAK